MILKIKKEEFLAYVFINLATIYYSIQNTKLYFSGAEFLLYFSLIIAMIQIMRKIFLFKEFKEVVKYFIVLVLFGVYTYIHNGSYLITILVIILINNNVNKDNLLRVILGTKLIMLFIGSYFHVYGSNNSTSLYIGIMIFTYIILHRNHMNSIKLLTLLLIDIAVYLLTNCGSGLVCITAVILMIAFSRIRLIKKILISKGVMLIYPIMLLITYILTVSMHINSIPYLGGYVSYKFNELYMKIVNFLDVVTSYRISLNEVTYSNFSISLWGGDVNVESIKYGYYYLDSAYFNLLYSSGIMITLTFMILLTIIMKRFVENKAYILIIVALGIALWGFNEPILLSFNTNIILLYCSDLFFYRKKIRAFSKQMIGEGLYEYT